MTGAAGIGKSSFVESLLLKLNRPAALKLLQTYKKTTKESQILNTPTFKITVFPIYFGHLKVTIIDTPGLGKTLDDEENKNEIISYLKTKFLEYSNSR